MVPTEKVAVIVLVNCDDGFQRMFVNQVLKILSPVVFASFFLLSLEPPEQQSRIKVKNVIVMGLII